ncbi:unnamed protein product [Cochlearia groenlandica]
MYPPRRSFPPPYSKSLIGGDLSLSSLRASISRRFEIRSIFRNQRRAESQIRSSEDRLKIRFPITGLRFKDMLSPLQNQCLLLRLSLRIKKSKRNTHCGRKERDGMLQKCEPERFEQADRAADEWREKEIAKDMLELALIAEDLRSLRNQKLKKQGHFLPKEDDKFFESVRAALELEENQTQASLTNT